MADIGKAPIPVPVEGGTTDDVHFGGFKMSDHKALILTIAVCVGVYLLYRSGAFNAS